MNAPLRFPVGLHDYGAEVAGLRALHGHAAPRTAGRPIDALLSRLEGVRQVKPGQWTALCPAHPDRHPSLSVAELPDGTVLLHCQSQHCPALAVVEAVGLTLGDLFPHPFDRSPLSRYEQRQAADACRWRAALGVLDSEAYCLEVAAGMIAAGEPFTDEDCDRLRVAACRIHDAREALLS